MSTTTRNAIRREVLKYVTDHGSVSLGTMTGALREKDGNLSSVQDSEVRSVVQPMIVTGKLSYAPGLKIKLGTTKV
jgi:hypothetical protein